MSHISRRDLVLGAGLAGISTLGASSSALGAQAVPWVPVGQLYLRDAPAATGAVVLSTVWGGGEPRDFLKKGLGQG
jgi:hypothetical protein